METVTIPNILKGTKVKTKATERLKGFLDEYYIMEPSSGSEDIPTAARDMLTDLMHLGDEEDFNVQERLESAQEPYETELDIELSAKTGVSP